MKTKWMMSAVAAGILVAGGCGKSDKTPNGTPVTSAPPDANNPNSPSGPNNPNDNSTNKPGGGNASGNQSAQNGNGGAMNGQAGMNPGGAPVPVPEPPKPFVVAAGKSITVILSTPLSSYKNQPGDTFEGSVAAPVMVSGEIAIPKGSAVKGTVVDSKKQGKFKGEANLALKLTEIRVNDRPYMVSTSTYAATQKGKGKRTAVVTGGGAVVGALIGGLAGGGKGAAIGAGVGGGGGLAASGATGGQKVNLPAESKIVFTLTDAVTIDR